MTLPLGGSSKPQIFDQVVESFAIVGSVSGAPGRCFFSEDSDPFEILAPVNSKVRWWWYLKSSSLTVVSLGIVWSLRSRRIEDMTLISWVSGSRTLTFPLRPLASWLLLDQRFSSSDPSVYWLWSLRRLLR